MGSCSWCPSDATAEGQAALRRRAELGMGDGGLEKRGRGLWDPRLGPCRRIGAVGGSEQLLERMPYL